MPIYGYIRRIVDKTVHETFFHYFALNSFCVFVVVRFEIH